MEFELTESVHVAFSRTKEEISKNVTLPYFNPRSATTLQTNASKKGLGAVILQDSKPVMFASRALTGSERNYQNLERECLVTIWGMEKFHYFLYGKEFTLETDQKPLVSYHFHRGTPVYCEWSYIQCSFNTTKMFHQILPKVFLQINILHPRSDFHGIQWIFRLCRICSGESVGLLVFSISSVQTCETWNYVEYSSPLVYSKFLL